MKKNYKKWLAACLAGIIVCESVSPAIVSEAAQQVTVENSTYEDITAEREDVLVQDDTEITPEYETNNITVMTTWVAARLKAGDTKFIVHYSGSDYRTILSSGKMKTEVLKKAFQRDMADSTSDGPYLYNKMKDVVVDEVVNNATGVNKLTFTVQYVESAEQTESVDESVERLLFAGSGENSTGELYSMIQDYIKESGASGNKEKETYQKIKAVHDYVALYVEKGDTTQVDGKTIATCSAYDALQYGKSNSAGYAALVYKLLKKLGIDCSIIRGPKEGDSTPVWNVVQIGEKWYHLDAYRDDNDKAKGYDASGNETSYGRTYDYFLLGMESAPDVDSKFAAYKTSFSMSDKNYGSEEGTATEKPNEDAVVGIIATWTGGKVAVGKEIPKGKMIVHAYFNQSEYDAALKGTGVSEPNYKRVAVADFTLSPAKLTKLGNNTVTVNYRGKTCTVTVPGVASEITSSELCLSFDSNGGSTVNNIYLLQGDYVNISTLIPKKDGATFGGWYVDRDLLTKCLNKFTITNDVTLYAKWVTNEISALKAEYYGDSLAVKPQTSKGTTSEDYVEGITQDDYSITYEESSTEFVAIDNKYGEGIQEQDGDFVIKTDDIKVAEAEDYEFSFELSRKRYGEDYQYVHTVYTKKDNGFVKADVDVLANDENQLYVAKVTEKANLINLDAYEAKLDLSKLKVTAYWSGGDALEEEISDYELKVKYPSDKAVYDASTNSILFFDQTTKIPYLPSAGTQIVMEATAGESSDTFTVYIGETEPYKEQQIVEPSEAPATDKTYAIYLYDSMEHAIAAQKDDLKDRGEGIISEGCFPKVDAGTTFSGLLSEIRGALTIEDGQALEGIYYLVDGKDEDGEPVKKGQRILSATRVNNTMYIYPEYYTTTVEKINIYSATTDEIAKKAMAYLATSSGDAQIEGASLATQGGVDKYTRFSEVSDLFKITDIEGQSFVGWFCLEYVTMADGSTKLVEKQIQDNTVFSQTTVIYPRYDYKYVKYITATYNGLPVERQSNINLNDVLVKAYFSDYSVKILENGEGGYIIDSIYAASVPSTTFTVFYASDNPYKTSISMGTAEEIAEYQELLADYDTGNLLEKLQHILGQDGTSMGSYTEGAQTLFAQAEAVEAALAQIADGSTGEIKKPFSLSDYSQLVTDWKSKPITELREMAKSQLLADIEDAYGKGNESELFSQKLESIVNRQDFVNTVSETEKAVIRESVADECVSQLNSIAVELGMKTLDTEAADKVKEYLIENMPTADVQTIIDANYSDSSILKAVQKQLRSILDSDSDVELLDEMLVTVLDSAYVGDTAGEAFATELENLYEEIELVNHENLLTEINNYVKTYITISTDNQPKLVTRIEAACEEDQQLHGDILANEQDKIAAQLEDIVVELATIDLKNTKYINDTDSDLAALQAAASVEENLNSSICTALLAYLQDVYTEITGQPMTSTQLKTVNEYVKGACSSYYGSIQLTLNETDNPTAVADLEEELKTLIKAQLIDLPANGTTRMVEASIIDKSKELEPMLKSAIVNLLTGSHNDVSVLQCETEELGDYIDSYVITHLNTIYIDYYDKIKKASSETVRKNYKEQLEQLVAEYLTEALIEVNNKKCLDNVEALEANDIAIRTVLPSNVVEESVDAVMADCVDKWMETARGQIEADLLVNTLMDKIANGTLSEALLPAMKEDNLCEGEPLATEVEDENAPYSYVTNFSTDEILTRLVQERDAAIRQAAVSAKSLYNEATDMADTLLALMKESEELEQLLQDTDLGEVRMGLQAAYAEDSIFATQYEELSKQLEDYDLNTDEVDELVAPMLSKKLSTSDAIVALLSGNGDSSLEKVTGSDKVNKLIYGDNSDTPALKDISDKLATVQEGLKYNDIYIDVRRALTNLAAIQGDDTNIYLKASFSVEVFDNKDVTYRVTFDSNGGSVVDSITGIIKGDTVTLPEEPYRKGYVFCGWYRDTEFQVEFTEETIILRDTTVYAKWEENSVHANDIDANYVGDVPLYQGDTIPKSDILVLVRFSDGVMRQVTEFTYAPRIMEDGDTEVTVRVGTMECVFTIPLGRLTRYNIIFNSMGGEHVASITNLKWGTFYSTLNIPTPTKEGYKFDGWYTSDTYDTPLDTTGYVNSNITLYAKWIDPNAENDQNGAGGTGSFGPDLDGDGIADNAVLNSILASYRGSSNSAGTKLQESDFRVNGIYSDGNTKEVTGFTFTPDTLVTGENRITITYQEKTAEVVVNAVDHSLKALHASYRGEALPKGAEVDKSLVQVTAIYSDGTTEQVTDFTMEPATIAQTGNNTITVKYQDQTTTLNVFGLNEDGTAAGNGGNGDGDGEGDGAGEADAETLTTITAVYVGSDLAVGKEIPTDKIVVMGVYGDGSSEQITEFTISPKTVKKVGENEITVAYEKLKTTVVVKGVKSEDDKSSDNNSDNKNNNDKGNNGTGDGSSNGKDSKGEDDANSKNPNGSASEGDGSENDFRDESPEGFEQLVAEIKADVDVNTDGGEGSSDTNREKIAEALEILHGMNTVELSKVSQESLDTLDGLIGNLSNISYVVDSAIPQFEMTDADVGCAGLSLEPEDVLNTDEIEMRLQVEFANPDSLELDLMEQYSALSGLNIIQYFDLTLFRENVTKETTRKVEETEIPVAVTMSVPKENLGMPSYNALRNHEAKIDILSDEDTNPMRLTFLTDRFSLYAMAYQIPSTTSGDSTTNGDAIINGHTTTDGDATTGGDATGKKNGMSNLIFLLIAGALIGLCILIVTIAIMKDSDEEDAEEIVSALESKPAKKENTEKLEKQEMPKQTEE